MISISFLVVAYKLNSNHFKPKKSIELVTYMRSIERDVSLPPSLSATFSWVGFILTEGLSMS